MDRYRYFRLITPIEIVIGLLLFLIIYSSCTDKRREVEYFDDNKIKAEHFVSNGRKDSTKIYSKDGELVSIFIYGKNKKYVRHFQNIGQIEIDGAFLNDTVPIGFWRYYDEKGKIKEVEELLLINDKPFLNQNWVLGSKQDTIKSKSNFFEIILEKDTIFLDEPVKVKVDLVAPFFRNKNSSIMVVLTKDYSIDFNADFSNLAEIDLDTTFNLNLEKEMRTALGLESDFRRTSIFGKYYNNTGPQKLRGIIVEYYYSDKVIPDSLGNNYYEKKQYFEKEIYVKDSMD